MTKPLALITGASSGIGFAFAELAVQHGYDVILVARRLDKLETLATQLRAKGALTFIYDRDLSLPDAALNIHQQLVQAGLHPTVLINNAGFGDWQLFEKADKSRLQEMIRLNVAALTELSHACLPFMLSQKKGYILNIGSTASFIPGPGMAVYHATKAYVLSFTEALSEELRGTGVQASVLCPGPTESEFQAAAHMEDSALVKGKKLPTSAEVARFGWKQMMQGNTTIVHGAANQMVPFMTRIFPRSWVPKMVRKVYGI